MEKASDEPSAKKGQASETKEKKENCKETYLDWEASDRIEKKSYEDRKKACKKISEPLEMKVKTHEKRKESVKVEKKVFEKGGTSEKGRKVFEKRELYDMKSRKTFLINGKKFYECFIDGCEEKFNNPRRIFCQPCKDKKLKSVLVSDVESRFCKREKSYVPFNSFPPDTADRPADVNNFCRRCLVLKKKDRPKDNVKRRTKGKVKTRTKDVESEDENDLAASAWSRCQVSQGLEKHTWVSSPDRL